MHRGHGDFINPHIPQGLFEREIRAEWMLEFKASVSFFRRHREMFPNSRDELESLIGFLRSVVRRARVADHPRLFAQCQLLVEEARRRVNTLLDTV